MIQLENVPCLREHFERVAGAAPQATYVPRPDEPPPRQFPLSGQSQARPLADPTRAGDRP
jgi:hypothetical protein